MYVCMSKSPRGEFTTAEQIKKLWWHFRVYDIEPIFELLIYMRITIYVFDLKKCVL